MRLSIDMRNFIREYLAGKKGEELKAAIDYLHHTERVSKGHLYRMSRDLRPPSRAERGDKGIRRIEVADEKLFWIEELVVKFGVTPARAIEILQINGKLSQGELTAATCNRIFREQGLSYKRRNTDVKPAASWEAAFPNQIHQFDTTKMEHLHYDYRTKRVSFNPRLNYKNSRGEKAPAIWLYLMQDDFSRCEFAYLYLELHWRNHLDFLRRAWGEKENPSEFPFFGIPKHIYMDNGGGNQAIRFLAALSKLGVHRIPTDPSSSEPYAARKRGKIEGAFKFYNSWEKEFQMIESLTWEEAQEFLYQRVLKRNRRRHATTNQAPFQRWVNVQRPLHMPDEEFYRLLSYERWTRVVDKYLTFSLEKETYKLPEKQCVNWVDETVTVYGQHGQRDVVIAEFGGKEVEAVRVHENIARPAFRYSETPSTSVEEARARAATAGTHGPLKLWETDRAAPAYMPRKGEPFDNSKIAEKIVETADGGSRPSFVPEIWLIYEQAAQWLRQEGFRNSQMSEAESAWLRALIQEQMKKNLEDKDVIAETKLREAALEYYKAKTGSDEF
ncbi:MAG: hypothetical protein HY695_30715 [Deltaproteobacteria bacterium]|nr:hypothetical protein [Deltaproteobacteria bacterium]